MSSKVQSSGNILNMDSTAVFTVLICNSSSWTQGIHTRHNTSPHRQMSMSKGALEAQLAAMGIGTTQNHLLWMAVIHESPCPVPYIYSTEFPVSRLRYSSRGPLAWI